MWLKLENQVIPPYVAACTYRYSRLKTEQTVHHYTSYSPRYVSLIFALCAAMFHEITRKMVLNRSRCSFSFVDTKVNVNRMPIIKNCATYNSHKNERPRACIVNHIVLLYCYCTRITYLRLTIMHTDVVMGRKTVF